MDELFLYNSFLDRVSKILKVFSESCVYAVVCLKISAILLKQFGNGGHLKSRYENRNLISCRNCGRIDLKFGTDLHGDLLFQLLLFFFLSFSFTPPSPPSPPSPQKLKFFLKGESSFWEEHLLT
jgi:hypothetical protein